MAAALEAVKVALVVGVATAATVALVAASTTEAVEALAIEEVVAGEEDLGRWLHIWYFQIHSSIM